MWGVWVGGAIFQRCGLEGVRAPDALLLSYPALNLGPQISPSRLLSLFDPLLPKAVLEKCMEAYQGDYSSLGGR